MSRPMKVFVVMLLVLLMLTACSSKNGQNKVAATSAPVANEEPPMGFVYTGLSVKTPVGEFALPEELNDKVFAEETLVENCHGITWYAMISDVRVDLYSLYIGNSDVGYYFGNAKDAQGNEQGVYVDVNVQLLPETLTEEQTAELNIMRESVNFIIEQIYALPEFARMS